MKEISEVRRENARALADLAGGTGAFAFRVDREPTQVSRIIGKNPSKNIGDRMARHIEACFGKPRGWLDSEHAHIATKHEIEFHETVLTDDDEPLRPDEVELPCFREIEFAAGDGRTQVVENHGHTMRFPLAKLASRGVSPSMAACATASGTSMEPRIMDGSTIAIDKSCTHIIDGKVYALDHGGMLRVKKLYRLPLDRIRLVSENDDEFPDEIYHMSSEEAPRIIGRVFWWEVFD